MHKKGLCVLLVCLAIVESRTIKTKIFTNENGTKELVLDKDSPLPQREIDSLIENLNSINITVEATDEPTTTQQSPLEENTESDNKTRKFSEAKDDILLKHWNSLTEVGWNERYLRKPVRKMYVNNTRILKFGPIPATELPAVLRDHAEKPTAREDEFALIDATVSPTIDPAKIGRRIRYSDRDEESTEEENFPDESETVTELPEGEFNQSSGDVLLPGSTAILNAFHFIFRCNEEHSLRHGLLGCVLSRVRSLLDPLWQKFDRDIEYYLSLLQMGHPNNDTESSHERTFYHRQRRFLHKVVFPLLVLVLVKYLMVLPFLLFGVFVLKSLLFGLLSAGTATIHSLAKKYEFLHPRYPLKRYRQVQGDDGNEAAPGSNLYWAPVPYSIPEGARSFHMIPLYDKFQM